MIGTLSMLKTKCSDGWRPKSRTRSEVRTKVNFVPHLDTGDFVVVINADKVRLTGQKEEAKTCWRHTGYVGGIHGTKVKDVREKHPERIVHAAVRGMLPKGPLGRRQLKKLKILQRC